MSPRQSLVEPSRTRLNTFRPLRRHTSTGLFESRLRCSRFLRKTRHYMTTSPLVLTRFSCISAGIATRSRFCPFGGPFERYLITKPHKDVVTHWAYFKCARLIWDNLLDRWQGRLFPAIWAFLMDSEGPAVPAPAVRNAHVPDHSADKLSSLDSAGLADLL